MDWHAFGVGIACLADPFRGGYPLICACTRRATGPDDLRRIGRAIMAGHIGGLCLILALWALAALILGQHHEVLGGAVLLLPVAIIHGLYHALGRRMRAGAGAQQRGHGAHDG